MQTCYPATFEAVSDNEILVRFPDLPEALTSGATIDEALAEATDCLSEALASRIARGEAIPDPTPLAETALDEGIDAMLIAPDAVIAAKVALRGIMANGSVSPAELARRLETNHKEARRILDPHHRTKFGRLEQALGAVGYAAFLSVEEIFPMVDSTADTLTKAAHRLTRTAKGALVQGRDPAGHFPTTGSVTARGAKTHPATTKKGAA